MALLEIPNEVLLLIAENLSVRDLSHFLLTSRHLSNLLASGLHDFAVQDVGDQTALQWAAERNHAPLAELVISKGAQLYPTCGSFRDPLNMAITHDSPDAFRVLIKHGAQISPAVGSPSLLHMAAECGAPRVIKVLMEMGAVTDMTRTNSLGMMPAHLAARWGGPASMAALLEAGFDISLQTTGGNTVLHEAIYGPPGTLEYLLSEGRDTGIIDVQNNEGNTALHLAVQSAIIGGVRGVNLVWLLENSGASQKVNACGYTPFEQPGYIQ